MDKLFEQSQLIWKPANPSQSRVEYLRRYINHKHGLQLKGYEDLHRYSIQDYTFWLDLWEFLGIVSSIPSSKILEEGRTPYHPIWFPGARLNYAENLLSRRDDGIAVTYASEASLRGGHIEHITWRELWKRVSAIAAALRDEGVNVGDRVAIILTNSPTAIAFALAIAAVGAIISPTAPDMGVKGILERYRQIRPCLFISETSAIYAGKAIDLLPKTAEVAKELGEKYGLRRVVLVQGLVSRGSHLGHGVPMGISLDEFLAKGNASAKPQDLKFEQLPFNQPLYILFSSGTSGPPKCILHSAGGVLLLNKKENGIGFGMGFDDSYFQFTTIGWMMWPAMLSVLSFGTRLITYDGSPFHPDVRVFLKFVSDQRVTVFGTSPRFLSEVKRLNIEPLKLAPFDSLRAMSITGSALTAPMSVWTQQAFGPSIHVATISGGTDICGCFVGPVESRPTHAGEFQGKCLGMAVEVFDLNGKNVEELGVSGELVCTRPHPSLPIGFWGDESGKKFDDAYFGVYPGVWRHGDFIVYNPRTKGLIILGRSDGVLNPSGVRFGSAEIYSVLDAPPSPYNFVSTIADSLCVGQQRRAGANGGPEDEHERVLLFLLMRPGHKLTRELAKDVRAAIRGALSPRHVPAYIFEITDIPYTMNNKKIEIAVKHIVSGGTPTASGTVVNPESLELYRKYYDLEGLLASDPELRDISDFASDKKKPNETKAQL